MADEEATVEAASKAVQEWCQANPGEHEPWVPPDGFGPVPERVVVSYVRAGPLSDGYERTLAFILAAVEDVEREPCPDWRTTLHDVALDIDRIVQRDAHPDDVMHARMAMHVLAGVWLSVEENEALHLGEEDTND